jgi:hypothetical protein
LITFQDGCDPTDKGCKNDFTSTQTLSYCSECSTEYPNGNKYGCQFYENIG